MQSSLEVGNCGGRGTLTFHSLDAETGSIITNMNIDKDKHIMKTKTIFIHGHYKDNMELDFDGIKKLYITSIKSYQKCHLMTTKKQN